MRKAPVSDVFTLPSQKHVACKMYCMYPETLNVHKCIHSDILSSSFLRPRSHCGRCAVGCAFTPPSFSMMARGWYRAAVVQQSLLHPFSGDVQFSQHGVYSGVNRPIDLHWHLFLGELCLQRTMQRLGVN